MKPVFDTHCHYHLFNLSLDETIGILKEEFKATNTIKCCFLAIPQEYDINGNKIINPESNKKGLLLKKAFAPNAYAYVGLEHPDNYNDIEKVQKLFLSQIEKYYEMGFDGLKMLEGYPTFIKYTGQGVDSPIYDQVYEFCEKHQFPITMHIANPDENWDIAHASKKAIEQGRVYDSSFPSKEEITNQMFNVLKRYPSLKLTLAHLGFFSKHYEDAVKFMSYPNTMLDITPGGEQLLNMSKDWNSLWLPFFKKYHNRIKYGTDFYPFPKDDNWRINYTRRPQFIRDFFETDTEHNYLGETFNGVKIDESILDEIYIENAFKELGSPRKI